MEKLLLSIANGLVNDPSAVQVTADPENEDGFVVFHLKVAQEDMGRVIGKQGKIAKSIRTIMRAAASKAGQKISIEIDD